MYKYRIHMNDGEIFNVSNDEPIELDTIAKARWMEIKIPITKDYSKKAYLNVAQINRIEFIEEVSE